MALALWLGMGKQADWLGYAAPEKFWRLALLVMAGAGTYFAALWLMGFRLANFSRRAVQ
jgi:putative peptidoglycan lipid II flippase